MADIRHCETCDKPFKVYPSTIAKGQGKFCSRKCADEGKKNRRVKRTCGNCQKIFYIPNCRMAKFEARFCSRNCYNEYRSKSIVARVCQHCGKQFTVNQFQIDRKGAGKFCSKSCQLAYGRIEIPCATCGKIVEDQKSRIGKKKIIFCNEECKTNYFNPVMTCQQCGNEFRVRRSQVQKGKGLYCGNQCKFIAREGEGHPNWNGGAADYYGPNWVRQRHKAMKRDNHKCQHCGTRNGGKHGLDVHHIKPFKTFDYIPGQNENYKEANRLSNLITLCRACHVLAERSKIPIQPKLL